MLFQLLRQRNINYEDLNTAEKETLENWENALKASELTIEKIRDYIGMMVTGVENELAAYDLPKEKDLLLKARLRNYILLRAFLTGPEKARKAMEQAVNNLKTNAD